MARKLSEIIYPELLTTQRLKFGCHLDNTYMLWKLKLTFVLKDHNVHHVLETTNSNILNDSEDAEHVAKYLILFRLDDHLCRQYDSYPTAKSIMDDIEKTHKGTVSLQTFLCGKYLGYLMGQGSDVNEHVFRMRAMAKLIEFSGMDMPEGVQALALLDSLSDEWEDDVEKMMMEFHASKEALSFDNVGKRLRVANELREWRAYRNSGMEAGAKRVKEKTSSTSNDDGGDIFSDFSPTLTEMFYPKLKNRGQLNYTGSDFYLWKSQTRFVLRENRVAYLLDTRDSAPEEDPSSRNKRLSDDLIARHILLGGMSDDLFLTFHDYPTARALMDALESWFDSPSLAPRLVKFHKYTRCKMPENEPMHKHLNKMDSLVANLKVAGVELPDEMQAQRLIDSLPRSWSDTQSMLRINIDEKSDDDEKTKLVDRVRSRIRSADGMRKLFKQNEDSEGRTQKRSPVTCFSCGELGHYRSKCPYK